MGKNELYTIKHYTSYTLSHIFFVNSKTSNFYSRIVVALLTKRYLTVNAVANAFLSFIQPDDIVQQTIISSNITTLPMNQKICFSQHFRLIVFRLVNQEFVQVAFGTLE